MNSLVAKTLTPTSSLDFISETLARMSSNVTPEMILQAFYALPDKETATRVALIAMSAAVSVRKVISDIAAAVNLNLGGKWMVDGKINFTMFAMLGHMIFLIPEIYHGKFISTMVPTYVASLGGKANIFDFGENGVLQARIERQEILRSWAKRMKGFSSFELISILDKKTVGVVKGTGFIAPIITTLYNWTIGLLLYLLYSPLFILFYALAFVWKYKFRLIFIATLVSLVTSPANVLISVEAIFNAFAFIARIGDFVIRTIVGLLISLASVFLPVPDVALDRYYAIAPVLSINTALHTLKLFAIEAHIKSMMKTESPRFFSNFSTVREFGGKEMAHLASEYITNYAEVVVLDEELYSVCKEAEGLVFLPNMVRFGATDALELFAESALYISGFLKNASLPTEEEEIKAEEEVAEALTVAAVSEEVEGEVEETSVEAPLDVISLTESDVAIESTAVETLEVPVVEEAEVAPPEIEMIESEEEETLDTTEL